MAKNGTNGNLIKWIVGLIFAAGVVYATTQVNQGRVTKNAEQIEKLDNKTDKVCNDVIGLQKDVFYIKEKVDTNAKVQQQILTEIKELRK